jgi:alkylhydroperoxidase family enzyme
VAHIRQLDEHEAVGAVAAVYEAAKQRAGSIANIIRVMSRDGASLQASLQFYLALMKSPNALDRARREMLAAVVANANDCYY